jgi:hypothetical protein
MLQQPLHTDWRDLEFAEEFMDGYDEDMRVNWEADWIKKLAAMDDEEVQERACKSGVWSLSPPHPMIT